MVARWLMYRIDHGVAGCRTRYLSLVTRPWLLPSPNGLAHQVEMLGLIPGMR